jgi:hypothetical protein
MSFRYRRVPVRSWAPVPDCERLVAIDDIAGCLRASVGSPQEVQGAADNRGGRPPGPFAGYWLRLPACGACYACVQLLGWDVVVLLAVGADDLHKHWWARTVSNRRPLVCKTRALPLSYAPVRRQDTARSAQAPKQPGEVRRSAPSAPRSTAAGHGPRRAASSPRSGSFRTGRWRRCRGWRHRRRR